MEMTTLEITNFTDTYPCTLRRPPAIYQLNFYTYGCITQAICVLGIVGNILNLVVLTRPKMKAVCYIYMRAKAVTDLIAILFTFPWAGRHLKSLKSWSSYSFAFYHCYFELYMMNSFVAAGIFLMLAITAERFISVCHPLKARTMVGGISRARITSLSLVFLALFLFIPYAFQSQVETIQVFDDEVGDYVLQYTFCENKEVIMLTAWKFYRWAQQVVCRILPVILIGGFNVAIVIGFRKIVKKRQKMKGRTNHSDFRDQRRLTFMLLGLSVMFFVCETPAAILIGQISGTHKKYFSFQVFRAAANLLEIVNYTFSFYAYCLASSEFRDVFLRLTGCKGARVGRDIERTSDLSGSKTKIEHKRLNRSSLTEGLTPSFGYGTVNVDGKSERISVSTISAGHDTPPSLNNTKSELSSLNSNSVNLTKFLQHEKY